MTFWFFQLRWGCLKQKRCFGAASSKGDAVKGQHLHSPHVVQLHRGQKNIFKFANHENWHNLLIIRQNIGPNHLVLFEIKHRCQGHELDFKKSTYHDDVNIKPLMSCKSPWYLSLTSSKIWWVGPSLRKSSWGLQTQCKIRIFRKSSKKFADFARY